MTRTEFLLPSAIAIALHAAVFLAVPSRAPDEPPPARRGSALAVHVVPSVPRPAPSRPTAGAPSPTQVEVAARAPAVETAPRKRAAAVAAPSAHRSREPLSEAQSARDPQPEQPRLAARDGSSGGGRRPLTGSDVPLLRRDLIKPRYPFLSRLRGEEGTVSVRVELIESGSVGGIEVARSSGHRRLDRAAAAAVRKAAENPAFVAFLERRSEPRSETLHIEFRLSD